MFFTRCPPRPCLRPGERSTGQVPDFVDPTNWQDGGAHRGVAAKSWRGDAKSTRFGRAVNTFYGLTSIRSLTPVLRVWSAAFSELLTIPCANGACAHAISILIQSSSPLPTTANLSNCSAASRTSLKSSLYKGMPAPHRGPPRGPSSLGLTGASERTDHGCRPRPHAALRSYLAWKLLHSEASYKSLTIESRGNHEQEEKGSQPAAELGSEPRGAGGRLPA